MGHFSEHTLKLNRDKFDSLAGKGELFKLWRQLNIHAGIHGNLVIDSYKFLLLRPV